MVHHGIEGDGFAEQILSAALAGNLQQQRGQAGHVAVGPVGGQPDAGGAHLLEAGAVNGQKLPPIHTAVRVEVAVQLAAHVLEQHAGDARRVQAVQQPAIVLPQGIRRYIPPGGALFVPVPGAGQGQPAHHVYFIEAFGVLVAGEQPHSPAVVPDQIADHKHAGGFRLFLQSGRCGFAAQAFVKSGFKGIAVFIAAFFKAV